jgi:UDP-N-acetylglucosamine/UDP-N-acetyl-alpha-D-glucosaminouronate 4-epimerase
VKSRVLVTGGAGFIGSHLTERLLAEGHAVRVLDNFSTGSRTNLPFASRYGGALEVIEADIRDLDAMERAAAGVGVIYHQAAMRSVPRSVADPLGANEHNVTGTLHVLEAARRRGVRRVVYASSSSVYGARPDLPKREDQSPAPISPYAASKLAGEQYANVWSRLYGVETVGLRYFNVFGPRQDPKSEYAAVIPRFILWGLGGEPLEVHGDGTQTRSFCHVLDAIQAVYGLMSAREISGEIFNVGSAERIRIIDLARRVLELTDSASELEFIPHEHVYGLGIEDVLHREPSIEKITAAIGWEPTLELDRILADVIADHDEAKPGERVAPPRTV